MALPQFGWSAPEYKQQPIVKRPNYSEIYLRNFLSTEARVKQSFQKVVDRIDKRNAEEEKRLLEAQKDREQQYNYESNLDDMILKAGVKEGGAALGQQLSEALSSKADILKKLYDKANSDPKGDYWTILNEKETAFQAELYKASEALGMINKFRMASKSADPLQGKAKWQSDPLYADLYEELGTKDGYDINVIVDPDDMEIKLEWTTPELETDENGDIVYGVNGEEKYQVRRISLSELSEDQGKFWGKDAMDYQKKGNRGHSIDQQVAPGLVGVRETDPAGPSKKSLIITNEAGVSTTYTHQEQVRSVEAQNKIFEKTIIAAKRVMTKEDRAEIWHEFVAPGEYFHEIKTTATSILEAMGEEVTKENIDTVMAAINQYGRLTDEELNLESSTGTLLGKTHQFMDAQVYQNYAEGYYQRHYAKHDKRGGVKVEMSIDEQKLVADEIRMQHSIDNLNGDFNTILGVLGGDVNDWSDIEFIAQGLNSLGVDNLKTNPNVDRYTFEGEHYLELEDGTRLNNNTKGKTIVFEYLKAKGWKDITEEEAEKIWLSWRYEKKMGGQTGWWSKLNPKDKGYYDKWFSQEQNKVWGETARKRTEYLATFGPLQGGGTPDTSNMPD